MSKSAVSPPIKRKCGRPRKKIVVDSLAPTLSEMNRWHQKAIDERITAPVKAAESNGNGRKPFNGSQALVTPERVEELAAQRLPISVIASEIGVCLNTFYEAEKGNIDVSEAFKRGRAQACISLAETAETMIGKDTAITAMALKQPPERGGLGWMDERSLHVEVSGEIAVRAVDDAWSKRRKLLDDASVIEAEFSKAE